MHRSTLVLWCKCTKEPQYLGTLVQMYVGTLVPFSV
nr:MAG TPA: hypothetical protein [Caudoviricetes sp.]